MVPHRMADRESMRLESYIAARVAHDGAPFAEVLEDLFTLAKLRMERAEYAQAEAIVRKALELYDRFGLQYDASLPRLLLVYARLLVKLDREDDAMQVLTGALSCTGAQIQSVCLPAWKWAAAQQIHTN